MLQGEELGAHPVDREVANVGTAPRSPIEALVAVSQGAVIRVREAKATLITKLKAQQVRLIRLHAEEGDSVSPDAFREERVRMQTEIEAAEKSLAETEQRLKLDAQQLRMALELAEDVAEVYEHAPEQTKRGYNQAFFKKLYVTPEWDEDTGQKAVRVVDAELTEPYAVLLADELVPGVLAEAEAIAKASESREGSPEGLPSTDVSYFEALAEREGFEPSRELAPPTRLAGECLQPLGHLSGVENHSAAIEPPPTGLKRVYISRFRPAGRERG